MGATEKLTGNFDPVPDDLALAVLANRRHELDRALEAVEHVPLSGCDQFKTLVIIISTNFAFRHLAPPCTD